MTSSCADDKLVAGALCAWHVRASLVCVHGACSLCLVPLLLLLMSRTHRLSASCLLQGLLGQPPVARSPSGSATRGMHPD